MILKREAANYVNLNQIISEKPNILHISCHGDCEYDLATKKNTFYLAFESVEDRGLLFKYNEEKLRTLLNCGQKEGDSESAVKLVFVSACHSEIIG